MPFEDYKSGGLSGGYDHHTLEFLADVAKRHKVTEVIIEANFGGGTQGRTLFIFDEPPQDVAIYDLRVEDFTGFLDHAIEMTGPDSTLTGAARQLKGFVDGIYAGIGDEEEAPRLFQGLSPEGLDRALALLRAIHEDADIVASLMAPGWDLDRLKELLGFSHSLADGYAFLARYSHHKPEGCRFVGYVFDLPLRPGMVLLDATSDIDGVSQLVSWRSTPTPCPQVNYRNLSLCAVSPPKELKRKPTGKILTLSYLVDAWREWVIDLVMKHTKEGDPVFLVAHKMLLPHLPREDDPRWQGREMHFCNWGLSESGRGPVRPPPILLKYDSLRPLDFW